ncbi:RloB family protein, partial [Holdemanella porci]|uniref:RloB family protein n=1 Tax=Holdemanella porci TaxID=2652276 RepID=UPI003AB32AC4
SRIKKHLLIARLDKYTYLPVFILQQEDDSLYLQYRCGLIQRIQWTSSPYQLDLFYRIGWACPSVIFINQTQSEYKINVAKGNNTDPEGVIRDLLKTAKQEELDLKQGDILACFIDVDFKQGREKELRAAIKLARQNNVSLYLSNPCFEVWYLLHFRYSTKPYCSNDEAIRDLNSYISDYSKSKDVFELIVGNSKQAIENSKKLEDYHQSNGTIDRIKKIPYTDVYKIVEILLNTEQ